MKSSTTKTSPLKRTRITRMVSGVGLSVLGVLSAPSVVFGQSTVEKLQEFDLEQVKITDTYYDNLFAKDLAYINKLSPDCLVAAFKAVSEGKDPKTATGLNLYGGWEGAGVLLRGHTIGHYLSAMARAYKQTKASNPTQSDEIKQKVDYTVAQLKTFQDKSSKGYLFGSPETHFDVVEGKVTGDQWAPWYTMHKIIAGLLDAYDFAGNETALQVASKLGDWVYNRSSTWDNATRTKVLGVEYGGMNDCLYELYHHTKNANHLTAAHRFDEETLFTPISAGTNVLPGKHANTQFPKFIGALNRYRKLGTAESSYNTAAQQFWSIVLRDHTYVTGGNSQLEHFRAAGKLNEFRDNTNNETCNSHNMLKLTRELFKVTGDVKYANFYETAYINEILAAVNPTNGMTMYFKPMGTGYFKHFGKEESFWCCSGTGMENYVKLDDSVYFHDATDLYVNLYVSSTLNWATRGLSLTQTATVPLSPNVKFTIDAAPAESVKIKFRKPTWLPSCGKVEVTVNGSACDISEVNGYLEVNRVWRAGDQVALTFPLEIQVSRLPDNTNVVAFTYGPVVLSAGLGTQSMVAEPQWWSEKASLPAGVTIRDYIRINTGTINEWLGSIKSNLVQTAGKLEFKLKNTDADTVLTFTPHYERYADRYGIYFRLEGTTGSAVPAPGACPPVTGAGVACGAIASGGGNTGGANGSGGTSGRGGTSGKALGGGGGFNSGGTSGKALGGSGGSNSGGTSGKALGGGGGSNSGGTSGKALGGGGGSNSGGDTHNVGGSNNVVGVSGGGGSNNVVGVSSVGGSISVGGAGSVGGALPSTGSIGSGTRNDASGCSCKLSGAPRETSGLGWLSGLGLGLVAWVRSRRRPIRPIK